ncbi:uncharacterized protein B0J16DRAFT_397487 [Fusarium flagelliforme]|uniref:Protein san1 n=1 Tax=Fusarium flagelliforme TaxID=2675880 RepID=A0A395MSI3_9HYPO|nr:uncharacterized protein B0J16DRAFT_397487 [Fusarium flagelliforme]KAH7189551.1 hypothetical protein B0J16DRAFT_397487 [Fusarium flagelliforme]RFN50119.1 protein san1 [Fusarium flagelliforme]
MSSTTENYLPSLMEIVQADPSAANRANPLCELCTEPMTLDEDVPNINLIPDLRKIEELPHAAYVLPCGHIFGLSCAAALLTYDYEHRKCHKCPICLFVLSCSHCWSKGLAGGHNRGVLVRLSKDKRERMLEVLDAVLKLPTSCLPCFMLGIAKEAQRLPPGLEALIPDVALMQKVDIQCRRDNEGWKITRLMLKGLPDSRFSVGEYVGRLSIESQYFRRNEIDPQLRNRIDDAVTLYMKAFDVFSLFPERNCIWVNCSRAEGVTSFHHFILLDRGNIGRVVRNILSPTKT